MFTDNYYVLKINWFSLQTYLEEYCEHEECQDEAYYEENSYQYDEEAHTSCVETNWEPTIEQSASQSSKKKKRMVCFLSSMFLRL